MNKFIASYVLFFLRFFFLFLTTNRKHQTQRIKHIKHFVNRIKTRCAGDYHSTIKNRSRQIRDLCHAFSFGNSARSIIFLQNFVYWRAGDLEKNNANIKTQKSRGITAAHIIARSNHEL